MTTHSAHDCIYGINPAFEVVRAQRRAVEKAALSQSAQRNPRVRKLAEFLTRTGVRTEWVEK